VKYKYCQAYNNLKSLLATEDRDLIDLMLGLLEIDPEERLTAKEALFHPFFGQLMAFELCVGSGNGKRAINFIMYEKQPVINNFPF
jgi:serine/threonine protein kinase